MQDNCGYFREQHIVSPDKVHNLLERREDLGWYLLDVNVGMDRLTEPFDLLAVQVGPKVEKWRIGNAQWKEMMDEAEKHGVLTGDLG